MAGVVKVVIPGIGTVEAQNAATEDTLLQILAAIKKQSSATGPQGNSFAAKLREEQEKATDGLKDWNKELKDGGEKAQKVNKESVTATTAANTSTGAFAKTAKLAGIMIGKEVVGALSDLAQSAISLTTAYMTSYDEMARDPIAASLTTLQTEVDMVASTTKRASTALFTGVGGAIGAAFGGPIGAVIGAEVGDAIAGVINKFVDRAAEMEKMYNEQMSKELKKSSDAIHDFTTRGASFANGMTELRNTASNAGLGIETLGKIANKSAADLHASGLAGGDATKKLAAGMGELAKVNKQTGVSMRDEMLAMGYSYEEQGEVMANYMAQQRAAGVNLQKMTSPELAQGAREYAQNLKVISDITGQDAKKLLEKSRAEALQAGVFSEVMRKGGPEAVKKLQNQLATMPEGLKKAYLERLSLGKVVDAASNVYMNANEKAAEQLERQASDLYDAGVSAKTATENAGKYSEQTGKYALEHADKMSAIGRASIAGVGGIAKETADIANGVTMEGVKRQEGATKSSADAAEAQANLAKSAESAEHGLAKMTDAATKNQVTMEKMGTAELGNAANRFAEAISTSTKAIEEFAKTINSVHSNVTGPAFTAGEKGVEATIGLGGRIAEWWNNLVGKADGGWSSGAASGFLEKLHGTELVIPTTSDGKLDPNSLGYSEMMKSMGASNMSSGGADFKDMMKTISSIMPSVGSNANDMQSLLSDMKSSGDGKKDELINKLDELITTINKSSASSTSSGGDMIANAFNGFQDMLAEHLGVSKEMAGHAKDNKDLVQKLLNASI